MLSREWRGTKFLKHARRFVDATGRLPRFHEVRGESKVGGWLNHRRNEAKNGKLSEERLQLIEDALGPDALLADVDFERKLADVAEHRRLHGSLPMSRDVSLLCAWLVRRRRDVNDGSLSKAHEQRLDTVLGAEWRPEFKNTKVRHPRDHLWWQPATKYKMLAMSAYVLVCEFAYHGGMCVCL